jgi:hypothetical protein
MEKRKPENEQAPQSAESPEIQTDREDSMGYTREPFGIEPKPANKPEKRTKTKLPKAKRKSRS